MPLQKINQMIDHVKEKISSQSLCQRKPQEGNCKEGQFGKQNEPEK